MIYLVVFAALFLVGSLVLYARDVATYRHPRPLAVPIRYVVAGRSRRRWQSLPQPWRRSLARNYGWLVVSLLWAGLLVFLEVL